MRIVFTTIHFCLTAIILGSSQTLLAQTVVVTPAPSTQRMADRLERIVQATDPMANQFMNQERAQACAKIVEQAKSDSEILSSQLRWAVELLNSGQTEMAIQLFDHLAQIYEANAEVINLKNQSLLRTVRAVANLRRGEQDNCLTNHTSESCLFPIHGSGVHAVQRGSRVATQILTEQFNKIPDDLRARWLLNVAYMTLGEYPDKVPSQWRLDPKLFESQYDIKRFPNIAGDLGVDVDDLAGGSIIEDFDGDGYLDIMASSMALRGQLRLFHNNVDGTFSDRTSEAGLIGEVGGLNIVQTEYWVRERRGKRRF
ncbi:MAG: VCBS repeat-containing protein [Verrucomicrobiota bacterium]